MTSAVTALDSAALVMDVVPAVMDSIRVAMRHGAAGQLSVPQFRCLLFVSRHPGCAIGAIAGFLGVTMPTASAMADRLVQAGLVQPQAATGDRRRSQLQVTAAGLAQLAQIESRALGTLASALGSCTVQELLALQAGLAVLRCRLRPESSSSESSEPPEPS